MRLSQQLTQMTQRPDPFSKKRIDQFDLLTKTIIQDTPHKGKHAIFKIPIDSNRNLIEQIEFWGKRSLRPVMCKDGCVMEIKMSTMQITLDPTKHRVDRRQIREYNESGYAKHKTPVLFQRYSNTQEQVLPSDTSSPNILDYYFGELTNVTDKRATTSAKRYVAHWQTEGSIDNRSKILIAKVLLISKFIADIPHFLVNVIGSPGAMKTHYLKFDKRLFDPGISEVHSPPITTKDIHQKFAGGHRSIGGIYHVWWLPGV